jgi:hypothetical protein
LAQRTASSAYALEDYTVVRHVMAKL